MLHRPHVALMIETSLVYGRRIVRGITSYVRSHQPWSIFVDQREDQSPAPAWLETWRGDGVISRMTNLRMAEALARSGVPLVDLNDYVDLGLPGIWSDHAAIGRLAAQHLLDRGLRHFAFCGVSGQRWSMQRREGFERSIERSGYPVTVFESRWTQRHSCPWEQERQRLAAWLRSLPKPVGIMACNDMRGQQVLDACRTAEIPVPDQVAVIGVDNDELLCDLCDPPLSSVVPNPERIGYEAAALLDAFMCGRRAAKQNRGASGAAPDAGGSHGERSAFDETLLTQERRVRLIEPHGIATRQSTDVLAVDDPSVAAAVRFIRQTACNGVTVSDVVERAGVSRSVLERAFRKHLGRTPQAEIRLVQVKRVKELLAQTDLCLAEIAELAGYEHPEYMCVVFKRETGVTPGQFRRQVRLL